MDPSIALAPSHMREWRRNGDVIETNVHAMAKFQL